MNTPAFTRLDDAMHGLRYDLERYNCFHFACDVLSVIRGERIDIDLFLKGLERRTGFSELFRRADKPSTGTLCLMRNPPHDIHAGVMYRGGLLHIRESGVAWVPPESVTIRYKTVKYYDFRNDI